VAPFAADQRVVTAEAEKGVDAVAAIERVGSGRAIDDVVAVTAPGVLEAGDRVLERTGYVRAGCRFRGHIATGQYRRKIMRDDVEIDLDGAHCAACVVEVDARATIDGVNAVGSIAPPCTVRVVAAAELD